MFKITFFKDANGVSEVQEYLRDLNEKKNKNKNARIHFQKIIAYMRMLEEKGVSMGTPYTKHLDGKIWELRPLDDRIMYAYVENDNYVILSCFKKKTRKTPKREIERAKRSLELYLEKRG